MHHLRHLIVLVLSMLSVPAARAADEPKITFDQHVVPILRQHCLNCHHAGDARGGLAMDNYVALMEGGGSGEVVFDDGDADGSRLWQLVNHDDTPVMPPSKNKLPEEQLSILRAWIEGGILENDGSIAKPKKKNALAAITVTSGQPKDGGAMPDAEFPQAVPVVTKRAGAVTAIAASPWAPVVAVAGQRQIVFYHSDSGDLLGVVPFEEGIAQSIRFSVDGSHLIVGGGTHSVRGCVAIYDVRTGQRLATVGDDLDTVFDADASADMTTVALGGPQKQLRIFDATTGEMQFDLEKHTDWIYSVAYSPDGILIASGDRSGGLHLWEAETGRLYMDLVGHKGAIRSIAWRDDSNVMASAGEDGTVRLWNVADGKQIKQVKISGSAATSIDFDHQGNFVVGSADDKVRRYDASGNMKSELPKMSDDVLEVAISHDNKKAFYGDWTGKILAINIDQPDKRWTLASNPPPVATRLIGVVADLTAQQKQVDAIKARLSKEQAKLGDNEAALKSFDSQTAQFDDSIAELNKTMKAATAKESQATALIKSAVGTNRELFDRVIAARLHTENQVNDAKVIEREMELAKQTQTLVSLRISIDTMRQTIAKQRADLKQRQTQKQQHVAKRMSLTKSRDAAKVVRDATRSQLDQANQLLEQIQQKQKSLAANAS